MIHALLISFLLIWTQSPNSTLTLVVRDGHDQPIAGLTLTVRDADGSHRQATTDASGQAAFVGLYGPTVTLTEAISARGQSIALDPTTPKDGLILGLIPGATRVVSLRLVDGLLFLDPIEVFAGTDEQAGSVPALAAGRLEGVPTVATAPTPPPAVPEAAAAPLDPPTMPMGTTPGLLWCVGGLFALIVLLIVGRRLSRIAH